jgi:hypothetical protein
VPVFISYSHQDKEFAEKLAVHLVRRKAHVWIDQWELKVGDSILEKIQSAIKTASALLVVLSKASVASEWCKKELSAGLMRELEERRVIVLPLLLEDCDVPMFSREKKHADFRTNYDQGLGETIAAIAAVTSDTQGRIEQPDYHTDWGADWGTLPDGRYALRFTFLDHSERLPYSAVTEIRIVCNDALSRRILDYAKKEAGWLGRLLVVITLNEAVQREGFTEFILDDNQPKIKILNFVDRRTGFLFETEISSRRLGMDTGISTRLDITQHLTTLLDDLSKEAPRTVREKIRRVLDEGGWPE